jgi:hypothetical protein
MTKLDEGPDGDARQAAANAVSSAANQSKEVAATATEGAKEIAQTAKAQASQVASEVAEQGKNLLHETKGQLSEQARVQTEQVSQAIRTVSDQAKALADGRPADAGPVADYTRQAATKLSDLAGRLDERGLEGVIRDVETLARRRPGTFLLGAAVTGFVVGRLFRGAAANAERGSGEAPKAIPGTPGSAYPNPPLQPRLVELDPRSQAGAFEPTPSTLGGEPDE